MDKLQELRNEILTLKNYGVINKEEEKSLLTKLNAIREQLRIGDASQQRELLLARFRLLYAYEEWLNEYPTKKEMLKQVDKTREETFLNMALDYKKKYKECAWWKFRKRNELYKSWQSALDLMMRYANK